MPAPTVTGKGQTGDPRCGCALRCYRSAHKHKHPKVDTMVYCNVSRYLCRVSCLLTHSTVQSPPWAANWFAASQEIPRISRNPKVHYRTHKRPPPVSSYYQLIIPYYTTVGGTAVAQWLRCCATNRKVASSIPDGFIGIFHWHKILPIALRPWGWLSL